MKKQLSISIVTLVGIVILMRLTSDLPISPTFIENKIFELTEDEPVNGNITLINIAGLDESELIQLIQIIQAFNPSTLAIDLYGIQENFNDSLVSTWTSEGILVTGFKNSQLIPSYIKSPEVRTFNTTNSKKLFELEILRTYNPNSLKTLEKRGTEVEVINYIRPTLNFKELEASTLLGGLISKSLIESQIVILGYLGENVLDHLEISPTHSYVTPLKRSKMQSEGKMFGIEISANIIWMILNEGYLKTIPTAVHYLVILIVAIFCTLILLKIPLSFFWVLASVFYFLITALVIYLTLFCMVEYDVYIKPISHHFIFLGVFLIGFSYKVVKIQRTGYSRR